MTDCRLYGMVVVCTEHTGMLCLILCSLCFVIMDRINHTWYNESPDNGDFICSDTCESVDH